MGYKVRTQDLEAIKKHLKSVEKNLKLSVFSVAEPGQTPTPFMKKMKSLKKNNDKLIKFLEDNYYI